MSVDLNTVIRILSNEIILKGITSFVFDKFSPNSQKNTTSQISSTRCNGAISVFKNDSVTLKQISMY